MIKSTLLWISFLLISLTSLAQYSGADPATTNRDLKPAPIIGGLNAPFSMTYTIGNNGTGDITGVDASEKMQFVITLRDCKPNPESIAAVSGAIFDFFDVTYDPVANTISGMQKTGANIKKIGTKDPVTNQPVNYFRDIVIAAKVTSTTATAGNNTIGSQINIIPNPSSYAVFGGITYGQPTVNDVSNIYTHTEAPMPVSLVSFSALAQEDRTVLLKWNTSWEQNNKAYKVERSKDLVKFEEVGEVSDVAGSSNSINSYQFTDKNPYRGRSYYRLRQLDVDGSVHTYKAEAVEIDGQYGVYPNPVTSYQFTLQLDEPSTAVIRLYNAAGAEIRVEKSELKEISVKLTPATKLTTGVYLLTVEERGTTRKHRIINQ